MDINFARFKLALYCCYSPVGGRLIHVDGQPLSDTEISMYLGVSVSEWMELKEDVLVEYFEKKDDGCIALRQYDNDKLETLFYEKHTVKSREIQAIVKEIQSKFDKKLTDSQILIEFYKRVKGVVNQPDWDANNWPKYSRMASSIIKKIGLESGMKVIQWVSKQKYGFWGLNSVLEMYDKFWVTSKAEIESEQVSERGMYDKYK